MSAEDWGKGYDAGQKGLLKMLETAEMLGAAFERKRIIKLLPDFFLKMPEGDIAKNLTAFIESEQE